MQISVAIMSLSEEEKKVSGIRYVGEEKELVDSKAVETVTVYSVDSKDADAALVLVGTHRTTQFSEEYNKKLRRKLVIMRKFLFLALLNIAITLKDFIIPPLCAAVYFTQFLYAHLLTFFKLT